MKTTTQVKREAKHLFRLCFVDGSLDSTRVYLVIRRVLRSKRRGYLALANQFQRLVRLDQLNHTAQIESETSLTPELRANVQQRLVQAYGPKLDVSFAEDPELIGGMRIKVSSDVYDGSIKAGLAALENSF